MYNYYNSNKILIHEISFLVLRRSWGLHIRVPRAEIRQVDLIAPRDPTGIRKGGRRRNSSSGFARIGIVKQSKEEEAEIEAQ